MIKGLNNKLSNVPSITGLLNVSADSVITDDLILNGIDVGTAIADLQQVTTGITYDSISDTTTVDNNVAITKTLNVTSTVTAPTFDGTATKVELTNGIPVTDVYLVMSQTNSGSSTLLTDNTGGSYNSVTNTANININGGAQTINITGSNASTVMYPTFVQDIGLQNLLFDNSTTTLTYLPNAGLLTTEQLYARQNSQINRILIGSKNIQSSFISTNDAGLPALTTGDFNVAIGGQNAQNLSEGSNNFSMGYNCMVANARGSNNCMMGHRAGYGFGFVGTQAENSYNTAVGDSTMTNASKISEATCIGFQAGWSMVTSNFRCTAIGSRTDVADGLSFATAIGSQASVTTSNTVQLGRNVDNVNCPNTLSVLGASTFGSILGANQIQATFLDTTAGVSRTMRIIANAVQGNYNKIQSTGDAMIYAQGATVGSQAMAVSLWSATTAGLRVADTEVKLGWGGTTTTPTHMLTMDTNGSVFNTVPKCATAPSGGNDLCNKTYVDTLSPSQVDITSTNTGVNYLVFAAGSGVNQPLYIDEVTTPLQYSPSTGTMTVEGITNMGTITGKSGATSLILSAPSGNTADLIIRHQNAATASSILIHTTGSPIGGDIRLRTNGAAGKGLTISPIGTTTLDRGEFFLTGVSTGALHVMGFSASTADSTNMVCGFNTSRTFFNANGCNTIYGSTTGSLMNVASQNNTLIGNSAGNQLTTGNNNTLVGKSAGDNIQGGSDNTLIGVLAGDLIVGGADNTAVGHGALDTNISGNDNVAIGKDAGNTITGSNNICIGSNAQVPVAGNSNQIAIGTVNETMFIRGGLRFVRGAQLSVTVTLPTAGTALASFYSVNITVASQTITLPAASAYDGHMITFKRKANNTAYTLAAAGGGTPFVPIGSITPAATLSVGTAIFQQTLFSDGSNWCVISQG
jgi:hypothetical protein